MCLAFELKGLRKTYKYELSSFPYELSFSSFRFLKVAQKVWCLFELLVFHDEKLPGSSKYKAISLTTSCTLNPSVPPPPAPISPCAYSHITHPDVAPAPTWWGHPPLLTISKDATKGPSGPVVVGRRPYELVNNLALLSLGGGNYLKRESHSSSIWLVF